MSEIGVVIQERRALLRAGIAVLLRDAPDVRVLGTVATAPELIELAASQPADVVLLELRVDAWDVGEVVRAVAAIHPDVCFAALHPGRRSDHLRLARKLGIDALVSYNVGVTALLAAVRGEPLVSTFPDVDRRTAAVLGLLTDREQEVLGHVAAGLTTSESAAVLRVRPKTVENHKHRIFSKLGAHNQAHAVAQAHRLGILRPASVADA